MEVTRQRVNLVLRLDVADVFEASGQVSHEGSQNLIGGFLFFFFENLFVGPQVCLGSTVGSRVNSLRQVWKLSLQIELLRCLLDLHNVVEHGLVDCLEARGVLRALHLGCEVDLTNDELA